MMKMKFYKHWADNDEEHEVTEEHVRDKLKNCYDDVDLCITFLKENPGKKIRNPFAFYYTKEV